MTLSYPSHIPSTRFPTGTVLALPAAFWFKDYHPYLSQYFSSCGSHYPLIRRNVLEYRVRFELTTLRICNPLQLTTLPPIHNHNILKHTTHLLSESVCNLSVRQCVLKWRTARDSNPEPLVLETRTLPVELAIHYKSESFKERMLFQHQYMYCNTEMFRCQACCIFTTD